MHFYLSNNCVQHFFCFFFTETIVKPNQKDYNYYHEQFRRVPTVDQCYDDDKLCKWEANQQLIKDKYVKYIIVINVLNKLKWYLEMLVPRRIN